MYRSFLSLITLFITLCASAQNVCPVIPAPMYAEPTGKQFPLTDNTVILLQDPSLHRHASLLQREMLRYAGIRLQMASRSVSDAFFSSRGEEKSLPNGNAIVLGSSGSDDDAYTLDMNQQVVRILGGGDDGIVHGIMTFIQLVRLSGPAGRYAAIPGWKIKDKPAMKWRGFMLDESRHFFGKATVKLLLDEMALYKLNYFHWHLTDAPGWRIEIKQYPRLALVGGIGNMSDTIAPAAYYTQEEISEIVAYAAERRITVIPEIDMPGHATAANKAYPEFSGGGTERYPEFTFNPGKEDTYQYLTNILREVNVLFPARMIHLGGDEVSFGSASWNTDFHVQSLMQRENFKSLVDVEHYFIRRMADSLQAINSKVLGWDEVTAADLPAKETIVFWWRQERPDQLKIALDKGYKVVLCPRLPLYFDFVQDSSHTSGRRWGKDINTLRRVYEFTIDNAPGVNKNNRSQILGIQANQWTEVIQSETRLHFMTFPRLLAMAEAAWSMPEKKDYAGFEKRLSKFIPLLQKRGLYVMDTPKSTPEPLR